MACGGCRGARMALVTSARRLDMGGAISAIRRGVQINVDKARGTYDESKYAPPNSGARVVPATPYKRPVPERTT